MGYYENRRIRVAEGTAKAIADEAKARIFADGKHQALLNAQALQRQREFENASSHKV